MKLTLPPSHDPFIVRIRRTVRERGLVQRGQRLLVACSGGADSTALLIALCVLAHEEDLSLHVGHVHHRLRGAEADADARWVRELAGTLGLPFHLGVADVHHIRAARGGSREEVARWARMALLRDMMRGIGAQTMALGHHRDDQAETILMHLLRGSGLTGLAGMSWGPHEGIIRPLLDVRREEIKDALIRWGIPWREDTSNRSLEFARNRLRHELIPYLAERWNPHIVPALARLGEIVAADDAALEEWTERAWLEVALRQSAEAVVLDCTRAQTYPLGIKRRFVRRAAHHLRTVRQPLSYAETERLVRLLDGRGRVTLRGKLIAQSGKIRLRIEAADAWHGPTRIPIGGRVHLPGWGVLSTSEGRDAAAQLLWPREKLVEPLVIRRWEPGDKIAPTRGRPPKLVADLVRRASPSMEPWEALIVEDAERIIWAIGVAAAEAPPVAADAPMVSFRWEAEDRT